jgi:hypothetical protein
MARSRRRADEPAEASGETEGPSSPAKYEELRAWHEFGKQIPQKFDPESVELAEAARKLGLDRKMDATTMRKARQFARTYSGTELEDLLRRRNGAGASLGWSHIRVLVSVEDRERRAELEREAVAQAWSVRELGDAVPRLPGHKGSVGGRSFRKAKSPEDGLLQLVERCEAWLRFQEKAVQAEKVGLLAMLAEAPEADPGDLLLTRLGAAERALERVALEALGLKIKLGVHGAAAGAARARRAAEAEASAGRRKRSSRAEKA